MRTRARPRPPITLHYQAIGTEYFTRHALHTVFMAYCSSYKVILLGDYGVGKTSLLKRLRGESFHEQSSSIKSKGVGREKCTKSYTLHNGDSVVVRGMIGQVQKYLMQ